MRVGEVVMLSIMAWRDDNGWQGWVDYAEPGEAGRVFSPRPIRERIEGEGPNSARGHR